MFAPPAAHPLFKRYPLTGQVRLSTGPAPTPYHIYDGYGFLIGGTADLSAVQTLLRTEHVQPLTTTAGRALLGVWLMDFTEASLGPHHELQFSVFVAHRAAPAVPAHPLAVLGAMLTRPETRMLCHGLWNSTERVVAYNREILGLNARLSRSQFRRAPTGPTVEFADRATGEPVLSGQLRRTPRSAFRTTFDFARLVGFGAAQRLAAQPWVEMKVVNPLGVRPRHETALAANHSPVTTLRYFDPRVDQLNIQAAPYHGLDFRPDFVQQLDGIRFIYLNPQPE